MTTLMQTAADAISERDSLRSQLASMTKERDEALGEVERLKALIPLAAFEAHGIDGEIATSLQKQARQDTWAIAIEIAKKHRYWGGFLNNQVVEALEARAVLTGVDEKE